MVFRAAQAIFKKILQDPKIWIFIFLKLSCGKLFSVDFEQAKKILRDEISSSARYDERVILYSTRVWLSRVSPKKNRPIAGATDSSYKDE